jgi:hypothetical protein
MAIYETLHKPILVIYSPTSKQQRDEFNQYLSKELKEDCHVLNLFGSKYETKVFFQKDQVELNKEELEKLLAACK